MPYIAPGIASRIKSAIVPDDERPRTIPLGLFAGLRMDINFRNRTQPYLGLFEREIAGWTRRLSKGAQTAMDIGCRDCFYAMYFAKRTDATVLAFDPNPAAGLEIERSMVLNGIAAGRVRYFCKPVGPQFPLDALLPLREPIFVKMDVEGGAEVEALNTAHRMIETDCRWLVETDSRNAESECIKIFNQHGLRTVAVNQARWRAFLPERRGRDCRWVAAWRS